MRKVMTIVGTRPELIKMSRVIAELDAHTDHVLVHTGQNYDFELNQIFFDDLGIRKPDYFLEAAGDSVAQTIGRVIERADLVFEKECPEAVLFYGDTNSCLAVIAAKRRKIPVFHMEAGNRCFDQRVPEELNRKIVDHLSDINMVLSEHARRYLIAEGIRPENIIKTGSHMREVLDFYRDKIKASCILSQLGLVSGGFFLVSAHREENVDDEHNLRGFVDAINGLAEAYALPVVISTHPRTRKRIEVLHDVSLSPLLRFLKPFGFFDYNKLQVEARCVVSDSGTISEEASLLDLPAVTIRNAHERPEGMDVGTLVMSSLNRAALLDAVRVVIAHRADVGRVIRPVSDYESPDVSKQVLKIVLSHIDYVKHTVWRS